MRRLLPVLPLVSVCSGQQPITSFVPADTFDAALDANGELSEQACFDLCLARLHEPIISVKDGACRVVDFNATTQTSHLDTSGTGTSWEQGVVDGAKIECFVNVREGCEGRHHASNVRVESRLLSAAGWLAAAATAEAASVHAFVALRSELAALGAPDVLLERCRAAAIEEVAHARLVARLARERGGVPDRPRFVSFPPRDALAIAVENAVEGCVGETWGATVAAWQATHADDADVRAVYGRLAIDEASHAALAVDLAAWLDTLLDAEGRSVVARARSEAVQRLVDDLAANAGLPVLGLPSPAVARTLLARLFE